MKTKKMNIFLGLLLAVFFAAAVYMTIMSQKNYFANCVDVEILEHIPSEPLFFTNSCFVENNLTPDGILTFFWDNKEVLTTDFIGDTMKVDVGNRILPATILKINDSVFTIKIDSFIGDILTEQPNGFTVIAAYQGTHRKYVISAYQLINDNGNYKAPLVVEKPKAWGTEYYIHYETVKVMERNHEKCAITGPPSDGQFILVNYGPVSEGTKVRIVPPKKSEKQRP